MKVKKQTVFKIKLSQYELSGMISVLYTVMNTQGITLSESQRKFVDIIYEKLYKSDNDL
jgi:hypothetical protein